MSKAATQTAKHSKTTTKKALIERIADAHGLKRHVVKTIVQAFLDEVIGEIGEGRRLEFRDFGVFEIKTRASRTGKNPKTNAPVTVPARRTVRFKMGRQMRELLDDSTGANSPAPAIRARHNGHIEVKPRGRAKVAV